MPLDGTDFGAFGDNRLAKLGEVERLLINEEQWCKSRLRDKDGRFCLAGAMQAVEARQLLDPIILRAAREISGNHYWRIESFNDNPNTKHEHVLRVLQRARENIIAGMIEDIPHPRYQRWARAFRVLFSMLSHKISAPLRLDMLRSLPTANASTASVIGSRINESSSTVRKVCEIS